MTDRLVHRRRFLRVAGVSFAAAIAGCAGGDTGDSETTETGSDTTTTAPRTTESGPAGSISVTDVEATASDRSVPVPVATLDERGWLVIHPEAAGGGPNGAVTLAERLLEPGAHADLSLTLDTLIAGEQSLYAMLHYDDPADGEFTFPESGDPPVTVDGSPVIEPFTVTGTGDFTPALSVTDQETDGTTVTVPRATIDGAGWLVIHPEAAGGGPNGGVTLAERRLQRGTYGSVALDLSRSLSEDQTLYAMLHYDDPADGEFTFPENGDPAVTAGGSPVIEPFDLTVSGGSGTATVEMRDTSFDPVRLSVAPGTAVEWVNRDGYAHDVTSAQFHDTATSWDYESGELGQGETATHTFEESGVYEYYCTIHGKTQMCGAVLVGDVSLDGDLPCEGGGGGGY